MINQLSATFSKHLVEEVKPSKTIVKYAVCFRYVGSTNGNPTWAVTVGLHVEKTAERKEIIDFGILTGKVDQYDAEHFAAKYIRQQNKDE